MNVSGGKSDGGALLARCVELLLDDFVRQGNHLSVDDVARVLSRRDVAAEDWTAIFERLAASGVSISGPNVGVSDEVERQAEHGLSTRSATAGRRERASPVRDYAHHDLLDHEQEIQLARRYHAAKTLVASAERVEANAVELLDSGLRARETLVLSNVRLVFSCVKPFMSTPAISSDDLVQEGFLGLVHAVEKYNPELGFRFSTYATWWINQAIRRSLADRGHFVRVPSHVDRKIRRLKKRARRFALQFGRSPTVVELALELDCGTAEVSFLLQVKSDAQSIDERLDVGEASHVIGLRRERPEPPSMSFEREELKGIIEQVLESLDSRARAVLIHRFGLLGSKPRTLEYVGRKLGITRERVRQIEQKTLDRIGQSWRASKLRPYAEDGVDDDV